jgi:DNA-binding GntR family transcriptional regulator
MCTGWSAPSTDVGIEMDEMKKTRGQAEQQIRLRILQAIFEQRMPAGARLTEKTLAETFEVSRTIIRQTIARLAQDGILVKAPSGATYVASPSRREVRQLLAVRRMIEPEVVKSLANATGNLTFAELYSHLEEEDRARQLGDRGTLVRLTGEFHLHLARLTGNEILVRLMTELQALVCLAIVLYASGDEACPEDEHRRIVEAVAGGDGPSAAKLMIHHLNHIEKDLKLDERKPKVQISETLDWLSRRNVVA